MHAAKNEKIPYDITALRQKFVKMSLQPFSGAGATRGRGTLHSQIPLLSSPSPEIDGIENETTRKGSRGGWAGQAEERGPVIEYYLRRRGPFGKRRRASSSCASWRRSPGRRHEGETETEKGDFQILGFCRRQRKLICLSFPPQFC